MASTPRGRRHTATAFGLFALAGIVAACNLLTGVGDLTPCEGSACGAADDATRPDGGVGLDGESDRDAIAPPPTGGDGAPSFDGSPCDSCDGAACCAPKTCQPTTGLCSSCASAGGTCKTSDDCCAGLGCTAAGKCANSCAAAGGLCFGLGGGTACCLGARCNVTQCVACVLAGKECNAPSDCCSGSCVKDACVGNIP